MKKFYATDGHPNIHPYIHIHVHIQGIHSSSLSSRFYWYIYDSKNSEKIAKNAEEALEFPAKAEEIQKMYSKKQKSK